MAEAYPYRLDMLPVVGITDITATTGTIRERLMSSQDIITGIRKAPFGYPADLARALDNIQFHIVNALTLVDGYFAAGHTIREPHGDVPGLLAAINNQVTAVMAAKPLWDRWYADAAASGVQGLPKKPSTGTPAEATDFLFPPQPQDPMTKSKIMSYVGIGLAALGAVWLMKQR
jgi:hypothetical protein